MRTYLLVILFSFLSTCATKAQSYSDYFINSTLRVDYIFSGNSSQQQIYLDELSQLPSWAGRKHHLSALPLKGNGQITVRNLADSKCIYKTSFSSLFQEWLTTDEANTTQKAFENTFLLPFPIQPIEIEVTLFDMKHKEMASMKHIVRPDDILIHKKGSSNITPHQYITHNGKEEETINVAILAEGYTPDEMKQFYKDATYAYESIFSHEPFRSLKHKFNVVAVAIPSIDSGVSIPAKGEWKSTALSSHFDTFYSARYLTTSRVKAIHDALAGIPYEHIIILANTPQYGGGGIYNAYTLTTAQHATFGPVVTHEFGHSFGGLGDEYFYEEDVMSDMYPLDIEPWEQNITTLVDFDSKWKDMLKKDTPIPTLPKDKEKYTTGVYEGGGYATKNIYRPAYNCRMRTNDAPEFCPTCQRALLRIINFYTTKK